MKLFETWERTLKAVRTVYPEAVIAGGAIRDTITGRPIKDVDIFIGATGDIEATRDKLAAVLGLHVRIEINQASCDYAETLKDMQGVLGFLVPDENGTSFGFDPELDLINGWDFQVIILKADQPTTSDILGRFDFGICQAAHDGDRLSATDAFEEDLVHKTFTLVGTREGASLDRSKRRFARLTIEKYQGWTLAGI